MGPSVPSLAGARYILSFIDEYTRYPVIYFLKTKDQTTGHWQTYRAYAERHLDSKIKELRCDNGGEYYPLQAELLADGITLNPTHPYSSQQNGIAERYNRTLMDQVRAILHESRAPFKLWGEFATAVNYLRQRTPSTAQARTAQCASLNGETPYQRWFGTSADVSNFRTLWSEVYMHQPVRRRTHRKLGARAVGPFRLVGYHPTKHGNYRLYDESTDSIADARDVTINETNYVSPVAQSDTAPEYVVERILLSRAGEGGEEFLVKWLGYDEPTWEPLETVKDAEALTRFTGIDDDGTPVSAELHAACTTNTDTDEPATYREAINSPYARDWILAIEAELSSHHTNKTWDTDTTQPPPGVYLVDSKWVFKVKRNADGSIKKFKARLVARGFTQREGIDFNETYAPVVKFNTLRALLALAAKLDLHVHQLDVVTAFLNGDLDAEIWMRLPDGVANDVVKLRRSLYGLKQSPRLWNKVLDSFLQDLGFSASEYDTALYIKRTTTKVLIVAVYVDDLTIFASDLDDVLTLKAALAKRFKMEDMGEISFLLGLQITRDRAKRQITVGQQKYVNDMINKFNLKDMRSSHVPMDPNLHLTTDGVNALNPASIREYQSIIGTLMYLMLGTRPDLAYSVSRLSQFLAAPTTAHMTAAKRVCAYAHTTANVSLVFGDGGEELVAYSDADYARCTDTRRSTSGYVFVLNGAAISWKSQRQKSTALSTAEAEYIALAECAKEALWMQGLLLELLATKPPTASVLIYEDNQAAIKLAANPTHHQRTKHIDVRYHFLRELVADNRIHLQYLESKLMLADALTKPLPRALFEDLRLRTGLRDISLQAVLSRGSVVH